MDSTVINEKWLNTLLESTKTCINIINLPLYDLIKLFNIGEYDKYKNPNGTVFKYTVNGFYGKKFVLGITWNKFKNYCYKPDNATEKEVENIDGNSGTKFINKVSSTFLIKEIDKPNFKIQAILNTLDEDRVLWFILIEDFIKILDEINTIIYLNNPDNYMIKYIKNLYNISDISELCLKNSIQKLFLKIFYGFPISHDNTNFFTLILVPEDNIIRPSFHHDPYKKPNINNLTDLKTLKELYFNKQLSTKKDKLLQKLYQDMIDKYKDIKYKLIDIEIGNTSFKSIKANDIPCPWTGLGYTYNWITRSSGFTEFIMYNIPNTTNSFLSIPYCNFNNFDLFYEYLLKIKSNPSELSNFDVNLDDNQSEKLKISTYNKYIKYSNRLQLLNELCHI
jgi:hypothetical protein